MNKKQSSYFNMLVAVKNVISNYESTVFEISSVKKLIQEFCESVSRIEEVMQELNGGVSGIAVVQKQKRKMLMKQTLKLTSGMYVFAVEQNLISLKRKVDFSLLAMQNMGGGQLAKYSYEIWQEAIKIDEGLLLYGITPTDIFNLKVEVDSFSKLVDVDDQNQTDRSLVAVHLQEMMNDVRVLINERMDKMILMFRESSPSFFSDYQASRILQSQGSSVRSESLTSILN